MDLLKFKNFSVNADSIFVGVPIQGTILGRMISPGIAGGYGGYPLQGFSLKS